MPNIGPFELLVILFIALLLLGPSRLPDLANALGKSIREFRKAAGDVEDAVRAEASPAPPPASSAPSPPATSAVPTEPRPAAAPGPSQGEGGPDV